ncbi:MAG: peptidoglycan DD-metalloendopeptidase family protein [Candidatus Peribacteraceae bacterium]|nr:peptidoglycan DD-metalloendopeptidase family protein [Candidatus Peribacteraceae bacterium]
MYPPADPTVLWLSRRVKALCTVGFIVSTLLPPYIPKAALAPEEVTQPTQQFLLVEDGFLMKSSSLTQQGARRAYAKGTYHTVKAGESLEKLASRYGISVETIVWSNNLEQGTAIQPNQELLILPVDGVLHSVKRGQTLLGIAEIYGVPIDQIASQNRISGGFIMAGQELIIPGGKPIVRAPTQVATAPRPVQQPTTQPSVQEQQQAVAAPTVYTPEPSGGVLQKPCSDVCFITQYYHAGHYALDLQERGGGPIYAAEAGTVIRADYGWNGGYGNVIEIDHGNGLITLYGHNKALNVKAGDYAQRGQKIADMGATGLVYGPTGIHVHFEVQLRGVKKNPLLYIQ